MRLVFIMYFLFRTYSLTESTERPIIGILLEEVSPVIERKYPGYTSYTSAAYVKSVEASGARVVPVFINRTQQYYRKILYSINGLLLPGGNSMFGVPGGYAEAATFLYNLAKQINNEGQHFPVLGVCLGFQVMLYIENKEKEMRTPCLSKNTPLPLVFKSGFRESQLFGHAPNEIIQILESKPVTFNEHIYCITQENLTRLNLVKKWRILSLNMDETGVKFISAAESYLYPFVGIQFHPEKNAYDWKPKLNIPHSSSAIRAAKYFFDWLVINSKRNNNKFPFPLQEENQLIYNYYPTFTEEKLIYEELYLFT